MMDQMKCVETKCLIDFHWDTLCKLRSQLNQLYDSGEPLSSERMVRVGIDASEHGRRLIELDRQYEDLILADLPSEPGASPV